MTTLRPSCHPGQEPKKDLVSFLQETVLLNQRLPTYDYLAACGIVPTNKTTYSLSKVEGCLTKKFGGYLPHVGCQNEYLAEVWYYHHLAGNIKGGRYVPTNTTLASSCPASVKYPPKLNL